MTTLDYGNLSSQILQEERAALIASATKQLKEQDQEYFGTQTYHNTVIFNLDVDLGALENAKYAVNAYSVKQYVNNFFNQILSPTANIEYKGHVTFSGVNPTQFAQSPVIHNALSLSSIDNLANFPEPELLKTPALVGDVKNYIDETYRLINLSLEYTAEQVVEARLNQILPDAIDYFIDISLGEKLAYFSDEYVFPRVEQQVSTALEVQVAPAVSSAIQDDLAAFAQSITNDYTTAIARAIESIDPGNSWTEAQIQNIAAEVDNIVVPDIVDTQLNLKVAPMAKAALADDLNALQASVTDAYQIEIAQAIAGIDQSGRWSEAQIQEIAATVDNVTVPEIVDTQLNLKVAPMAKAALADDLNALQASVTDAYQIEIAQAIAGIDQSGRWSEAQIQEIAAAVDNVTVPEIVDTQLTLKVAPMAKAALADDLNALQLSVTDAYQIEIAQAIAGIDQSGRWSEAQIQEIAAAVDNVTVPEIVDTQLTLKVAPMAKAALADDLNALQLSVTDAYQTEIAQAIAGIDQSGGWSEAQIQEIAAAVDNVTVPEIVDTQLNLKVAPMAKAALADDLNALQASVTDAYQTEIAQAIAGIDQSGGWSEAQIQEIAAAVDNVTVPDIVANQLSTKLGSLGDNTVADALSAMAQSITTDYRNEISQAIESIGQSNSWTQGQIEEIAAAVDNIIVPDIVDTQLSLKVAPLAKAALASDLYQLETAVTEAYTAAITQAVDNISQSNNWTQAQIEEIAANIDMVTVPDIVDAQLNLKVAPLAITAIEDSLNALQASVTEAYRAEIAQALQGIEPDDSWTQSQIENIAAAVSTAITSDIVDNQLSAKLGALGDNTVADALSAMTQSITTSYRAEINQAIEDIGQSSSWTQGQIEEIAAAVDNINVPDIVDTQLNLKVAPLAKAAIADDLYQLENSVTEAYTAAIVQAIDNINQGSNWTQAQIESIAANVDTITVPDIVNNHLNAKLGTLGEQTVADALFAMAQSITTSYRTEINQAIESIDLGNSWTQAQIENIAANVDSVNVPQLIDTQLSAKVAPLAKAALADDLNALVASVTAAYQAEITQAIDSIEQGNQWTQAQIEDIAANVDSITVPQLIDTQLSSKVAPLAKAALADDLNALVASVTAAYQAEITQAIDSIDQGNQWTQAQIEDIAANVDTVTVPDIVDAQLSLKVAPLAKVALADDLLALESAVTEAYNTAITQALDSISQGNSWNQEQIESIAAAVDAITVPSIVDNQLNAKLGELGDQTVADALFAMAQSITQTYRAEINQGIDQINNWTQGQIEDIAANVDTITVPEIVDNHLNAKLGTLGEQTVADALSTMAQSLTTSYRTEINQAIESIDLGNSWTQTQIENIAANVDSINVPQIIDTQLSAKVAPLAKAALADDLSALVASVTAAYQAEITQAIDSIAQGTQWTQAQIEDIAANVDIVTVPDIVDTQLTLKVAPLAQAALVDDLNALQAAVTEAYKADIAQAIESMGQGIWNQAQIEEIAAAVDNITVPDIVATILAERLGDLGEQTVADTLSAISQSITQAYRTEINEAIEQIAQGAWSQAQIEEIAAAVDSVTVPDMLDAQLPARVAPLAQAAVENNLNALQTSITDAYRAEIAQAIENMGQGNQWTQAQIEDIAAAIDHIVVPGIVDTQLEEKLAPLAQAALVDDLSALQATVTEAYRAEIAQAIENIGQGIWSQAQIEEIAAAVDNVTVPGIVEDKLNEKLGTFGEQTVADALSNLAQSITETYRTELSQAIDSINLGNHWTQEQIQEIAATVDAITVPDMIDAQLNEDTLWPIIASKTAAQIDTHINGSVVPKIAQEVDKQLPDILSTVVQLEISNQLPLFVSGEVDKAFGAITSELPSLVEFKINEGLKDEGSIAAYFQDNVTALAQGIVQEYVDTTVSPFIELIVPEYALNEVQAALQEAVPDLVDSTVRTVVDTEVETLKSTFIPNLVTLKLTETVPQLVEDRMAQILTRVSLPKRLRFEFSQQSTQWIVQHERNTKDFSIEIFNSQGVRMFAHHEIIDDMSFVVSLTEALTGFIDVVFYS
ncbi:hypothetical protein F9Y84_11345 [Pseudoalteromonas peptidolytica]|uniref:hypothetical protein n=2 Tax=Pseudoalteromonas peptidolytica TaxID=61150 RepID=UPI00145591DE|nr:hypothetical protein [Pseudoalteromonas peptidolytica]NLR15261.1 hypothetical protein [Pseudoalteromonas peptidolytica]